MKVNELTARAGNIELTAEVSDIGQAREFNKFGKSGKVATARLKDETGEIEISLWNEQIDQIGVGDTVKISNGYVKEYQGELQLTTGMRGTLEIVKKGEKKAETVPKEQPEDNSNQPSGRQQLDEEDIEDD